MDLEREIAGICLRARVASRRLAPLPRASKDAALLAYARLLRTRGDVILQANAEDVRRAVEGGTAAAMVDRLALDAERLEGVARAIEEIAALPDPVGEVITDARRPNGLRVRQTRVPLGVIAMIYEARPNVTAEASALCVKSGNAVVLRGGREAARSNAALGHLMSEALRSANLPEDVVSIVPPEEREAVRFLIQQTETVDLAIPRGGESLIRYVTEHARVPVVQHFKGVCHLFIDRGADVDMAIALALNGKLSRPAVCNALECLLIDGADAGRLLPPIARALVEGGCELRGCPRTQFFVPAAALASPDDYGREYSDRILAVRVVDDLDGALEHIARFGSGHTEVICTNDPANADRFRREVDAACVAVNASSRFHDGGELGLGAEIGIATSRIHWRGPMGLLSLTTIKWVLDGEGQVR